MIIGLQIYYFFLNRANIEKKCVTLQTETTPIPPFIQGAKQLLEWIPAKPLSTN